MSKICKDCGIEKDLELFYKRSDSKDGRRNNCKECQNIKAKPCTVKYQKKESSMEKKREYNKEYWSVNSEVLSIKNSEKYYKNRDFYLLKKREFYYNNREMMIDRSVKYYLNRRKVDYIFRLKEDTRGLIRKSIYGRGYKKSTKTESILGCSFDEFRLYLESKFEDWMTWENRSLYNGELSYGWDIDHIIPISSAKNEQDVILLNHYSNLQPLCSRINRDIKRDRIDYIKIDTI